MLPLLFFSVHRHAGVELSSEKFSVSSAWLTEVSWSFPTHSVLLQSQPPYKPAETKTVPLSGFSQNGHRYGRMVQMKSAESITESADPFLNIDILQLVDIFNFVSHASLQHSLKTLVKGCQGSQKLFQFA